METDDLEELKTAFSVRVAKMDVRIARVKECIGPLSKREIWERVYATLAGGSFIMLVELLFNVPKENRNFSTEVSLCLFAISIPVNVVMYLMHTPEIHQLYLAHSHKKSFEIYQGFGFFIAQVLPQVGLVVAISSISAVAGLAFFVASIFLTILLKFMNKAGEQINKDIDKDLGELRKDQDKLMRDLQEVEKRQSADTPPLNGLTLDSKRAVYDTDLQTFSQQNPPR
jgi:hypothetical protein